MPMACPRAWGISCPCNAWPEVNVEKPGPDTEMMLKGCHLDGCWELQQSLDSYRPIGRGFGGAGSGHVLRGHQTDKMVWVQVSASTPQKKSRQLKAKNPFQSSSLSPLLRVIEQSMTGAAPVTFHLVKDAWEPQMKPTDKSVEQFYRLLHYINKNRIPNMPELHHDPEQ